jgi:hypothetical protein
LKKNVRILNQYPKKPIRLCGVTSAQGRWVDYDWKNPATGKVIAKSAYILGVGGDLALGCAIYK